MGDHNSALDRVQLRRFTYRFTQNEEPRLPPISVHNTLHSTFCGIGYPDLDIWRMRVSQIIHCLKL